MRISLILSVICLAFASFAQDGVPRFAKYPVLETGCFYYLPGPAEFELDYSEDGAKVITGEVQSGEHFFSTITIEFTKEAEMTLEDVPSVMEGYLGYLMGVMDIVESAGIGWGHSLDSNPNAIGAIDYWVDSEGTQFAVKAWCDEHFMAVLMVYGNEEYPYFNAQQLFLDGFRFP